MGQPKRKAVFPSPERLTWKQICKRHPDEWVMLIEVDWVNDTDFDFETAVVVGHSRIRREALFGSRPFRQHVKEAGIFFTGKPIPPPPLWKYRR